MEKQVRSLLIAVGILALLWLSGCKADQPNPTWSWESLGYVSEGSAGEYWETYSTTAIAFSLVDRAPMVAFCDSGAIKIKKWSSGSNWIDLGFPGAGWYPSLAIDPSDGKPIVAFSGSAHVMKWSTGTTWADFGSAGTGPQTLFTCIAVDPADDKPVVAFAEDQGSGGRVHVLKWSNGTTWTDLGYPSTGRASYVSLAVGRADSKPIVAYSDVDGGYVTRVMKWSNGTSWDDLGFPDWLEGTDTALAIDRSDNKPIVINRSGYVYKWSVGTSWTNMGTPIPYGRVLLPSMVLDPANQAPMVAFIDDLDGYTPCVYNWLGVSGWSDMGRPSSQNAGHPSLTIDPAEGNPIVIFTDRGAEWRAHVMTGKYE